MHDQRNIQRGTTKHNRVHFAAVLSLLLVLMVPGSAFAFLSGDVDGKGDLNVSDVQCAVLAVLDITPNNPATTPDCLASLSAGDMDCSDNLTVVDVQLVVQVVLGGLVNEYGMSPSKDVDNDNVHNQCDICPGVSNPGQEDSDLDTVGDACDATPTGGVDCDGVDNGAAHYDQCGVCVGGDTGKLPCDCNEEAGGEAYYDDCGTCVGGSTGKDACATDCNGDLNGTAELDGCDKCVGGDTGLEACAADCNDDFGGLAIPDSCNVCSGGNTNHVADSDKDCAGVCFGEAALDLCAHCDADTANDCEVDCNGDAGGSAYMDDCGTCVGGATDKPACAGTGCFVHFNVPDLGQAYTWVTGGFSGWADNLAEGALALEYVQNDDNGGHWTLTAVFPEGNHEFKYLMKWEEGDNTEQQWCIMGPDSTEANCSAQENMGINLSHAEGTCQHSDGCPFDHAPANSPCKSDACEFYEGVDHPQECIEAMVDYCGSAKGCGEDWMCDEAGLCGDGGGCPFNEEADGSPCAFTECDDEHVDYNQDVCNQITSAYCNGAGQSDDGCADWEGGDGPCPEGTFEGGINTTDANAPGANVGHADTGEVNGLVPPPHPATVHPVESQVSGIYVKMCSNDRFDIDTGEEKEPWSQNDEGVVIEPPHGFGAFGFEGRVHISYAGYTLDVTNPNDYYLENGACNLNGECVEQRMYRNGEWLVYEELQDQSKKLKGTASGVVAQVSIDWAAGGATSSLTTGQMNLGGQLVDFTVTTTGETAISVSGNNQSEEGFTGKYSFYDIISTMTVEAPGDCSSCGANQFECADGSCKDTQADCPCPTEKPHKCSNGTCVADDAECNEASTCPFDETVQGTPCGRAVCDAHSVQHDQTICDAIIAAHCAAYPDDEGCDGPPPMPGCHYSTDIQGSPCFGGSWSSVCTTDAGVHADECKTLIKEYCQANHEQDNVCCVYDENNPSSPCFGGSWAGACGPDASEDSDCPSMIDAYCAEYKEQDPACPQDESDPCPYRTDLDGSPCDGNGWTGACGGANADAGQCQEMVNDYCADHAAEDDACPVSCDFDATADNSPCGAAECDEEDSANYDEDACTQLTEAYCATDAGAADQGCQGEGCSTDLQCGDGKICNEDGACVENEFCENDGQCADGEMCNGAGACVPGGGGDCGTMMCPYDADGPANPCNNDYCADATETYTPPNCAAYEQYYCSHYDDCGCQWVEDTSANYNFAECNYDGKCDAGEIDSCPDKSDCSNTSQGCDVTGCDDGWYCDHDSGACKEADGPVDCAEGGEGCCYEPSDCGEGEYCDMTFVEMEIALFGICKEDETGEESEVCQDYPDWEDNSWLNANCDGYAKNECASSASYADDNGVDANEACCLCGGGNGGGGEPVCQDDADWVDSSWFGGANCDGYAKEDCASAAAYADANGVDATTACCICGGGTDGSSTGEGDDGCTDNNGCAADEFCDLLACPGGCPEGEVITGTCKPAGCQTLGCLSGWTCNTDTGDCEQNQTDDGCDCGNTMLCDTDGECYIPLWEDAKVVLDAKCTGCHTWVPGSGGWNTGDYSSTQADSNVCQDKKKFECMGERIHAGSMPQGAGCTGDPVQDAGNTSCLTAEEQAIIDTWIAAGGLENDGGSGDSGGPKLNDPCDPCDNVDTCGPLLYCNANHICWTPEEGQEEGQYCGE